MRLTITTVLLGLALAAVADEHRDDADRWYNDRYATLWEEAPWTKLDEIAGHYATTVTYHAADENPTVHDSKSWLGDAMDAWVAEAWVGSDLVGFRSVQVNPSVTSIYTQWLDRYEGGYEETSCGWYIGAKLDGEWKLTNYAAIDCAEHGF